MEMVAAVLQAEDMQPTVRVILFSLLSASWTLFEALSGDTWVALLNSRARQLGSQVVASLSDHHDSEGIARRGISLRFLAKHGFDLSNVLGTLLSKRFDFTSLSGIRRAYRSAFPGLALDLLNDADLKLLQAYRHVIVHRAGVVDQSFIDTTKLDNAFVGSPAPLEERSAESMLTAAARCGTRLVSVLDEWTQQHPTQG